MNEKLLVFIGGFILLWSIVIGILVRASGVRLWLSGNRYEHIPVHLSPAVPGLRHSRTARASPPCCTWYVYPRF